MTCFFILKNTPFLSGRFFRGFYVALVTRTMLFFLWLHLTARLNLRKEHTFFEPFPRNLGCFITVRKLSAWATPSTRLLSQQRDVV